MSKINYVRQDGTPVPGNACIQVDNITTTFTVTLRSLGSIGVDQLRSLLQTKHEVVQIEHVSSTVVVR